MRRSQMLLPTLREDPKDAEIASHILMMRAGIIRKLDAGLYTFLPLGHRVLLKVINIIREEMNRAGAQELLPPILIPASLWRESGRYDIMGKEMMRLQDRHENDMVLGPTHEEVFTHIVRENVQSYRDLPLNLYQINTKFRDEIRPRYGVMRCREFIMKDAYSFDIDEAGLEKNYQAMREAYRRIFARCGLEVVPVQADTGNMGGSNSEEFMVPSSVGEETIIHCRSCGYVANVERAESKREFSSSSKSMLPLEEIATPNVRTIEELVAFLKVSVDRFIKSLVYKTDKGFVLVLIRGDFMVNETKLKHVLECVELEQASEEEVLQITGAPIGFVSPVNLKQKIKIVADESIPFMRNAISGANKKDYHLKNINPERDFVWDVVADIHEVVEGEKCPTCGEVLRSYKGIEVGHIFKLGYKYTEAMNVRVLDKNGQSITPIMGCYGIGVGRTIASVIEQNHDENGIIWPMSIAPFHGIIVPVNMSDSRTVEAAEKLYQQLSRRFEILLDDRDERPGVKFKDADLIGIPIRITIGKSFAEEQKVELKLRRLEEKHLVPLEEVEKVFEEWYEKEMAPYLL
ncbi:proline--tRNA ligase [Thermospira aquatica]|uniref:Proline--tRNA ligase n=1 Tax=Thermospira aquatica TaxID=2828656 RepID=A0AAX3BCS8_9SPIR|nr:proline--tRNA ligase [Thermospira aquatica]URA10087.1 proline--tRNA ligase [Thermospira aquatica]